ncbi:MAG: DDE transposase family protein [Acidobacterium ailaaui]|nr:DDE transposase family protein [Pseudacidobacterium ailaaui]
MRNKLSDKRQKAKALFITGKYTQQEIAKIVGVTPKTIIRWKTEERWEELNVSLLTTRENELRRLYKMLKVMNDEIDEKAQDGKPINSKEADALLKLTQAIKNLELETSIADKVEVGMDFIEFVRRDNPELAKTITQCFDQYIQFSLK